MHSFDTYFNKVTPTNKNHITDQGKEYVVCERESYY